MSYLQVSQNNYKALQSTTNQYLKNDNKSMKGVKKTSFI